MASLYSCRAGFLTQEPHHLQAQKMPRISNSLRRTVFQGKDYCAPLGLALRARRPWAGLLSSLRSGRTQGKNRGPPAQSDTKKTPRCGAFCVWRRRRDGLRALRALALRVEFTRCENSSSSPSARVEPRVRIVVLLLSQTQKTPRCGACCVWRRRRDSNPRWGS